MPPRSREPVLTTAPMVGGGTGDIMRKTAVNLYISWLLVFGGSGALLRRTA